MIGRRVKWTGVFEKERVEESGEIVAIDRGGNPAVWSILVLSDEGKLRAPVLDCIEIPPGDDAATARAGQDSLEALEYLERWIAEQFPGVEDAGGGPIERATQLLLELKTELLQVGAERDKLAEDLTKMAEVARKAEAKKAKADAKKAAEAKPTEEPAKETP